MARYACNRWRHFDGRRRSPDSEQDMRQRKMMARKEWIARTIARSNNDEDHWEDYSREAENHIQLWEDWVKYFSGAKLEEGVKNGTITPKHVEK